MHPLEARVFLLEAGVSLDGVFGLDGQEDVQEDALILEAARSSGEVALLSASSVGVPTGVIVVEERLRPATVVGSQGTLEHSVLRSSSSKEDSGGQSSNRDIGVRRAEVLQRAKGARDPSSSVRNPDPRLLRRDRFSDRRLRGEYMR